MNICTMIYRAHNSNNKIKIIMFIIILILGQQFTYSQSMPTECRPHVHLSAEVNDHSVIVNIIENL
jgi:hypothetical protein